MKLQRWQYKVIVLDTNTEQSTGRLDNLGTAGWELVGIGGRYEAQQYAYLKRAIGGWRPISGNIPSGDQQVGKSNG